MTGCDIKAIFNLRRGYESALKSGGPLQDQPMGAALIIEYPKGFAAERLRGRHRRSVHHNSFDRVRFQWTLHPIRPLWPIIVVTQCFQGLSVATARFGGGLAAVWRRFQTSVFTDRHDGTLGYTLTAETGTAEPHSIQVAGPKSPPKAMKTMPGPFNFTSN